MDSEIALTRLLVLEQLLVPTASEKGAQVSEALQVVSGTLVMLKMDLLLVTVKLAMASVNLVSF